MNYVAAACAIIAMMRAEQGGDKMRDLLLDTSSETRMKVVNLEEVYYLALRRGPDEAAKVIEQVSWLDIQVRRNLDDDFIPRGKWKAGNRIAYADASVLSLAERDNTTVVTTDHGELDPVAAQRRISFLWATLNDVTAWNRARNGVRFGGYVTRQLKQHLRLHE